MKSLLHIIIFSLLGISHGFAQENPMKSNKDRYLTIAKENMEFLDSAIAVTLAIDQLDQLKIGKWAQTKNAIETYCENDDCEAMNKKLHELGLELVQREEDLHSGNYINLKLKTEINERLEKLTLSIASIDNKESCELLGKKLERVETKFNLWMENNEKMPEWKTTTAQRIRQLKEKQKEILLRF